MLSSIVLLLVSSTFLVQNNYYASQTQRTGAHDNVRVATELVASELRSAMDSGIVVAGNRTLTVRTPIVLGVICNRSGAGDADLHTDGGPAGLATTDVAGIAARDASTGLWTYATVSWATLDRSDVSSPGSCATNGADTLNASAEFHRVGGLDGLFITVPDEGDVVMLFRETTFKIQASELEPTSLGLFRAVGGGALVEFATGVDSTTQFQYRTGGTSYSDTVMAASLGDIDAVRIVAQARKAARTGGQDDVTFGWAVNVALRNVN